MDIKIEEKIELKVSLDEVKKLMRRELKENGYEIGSILPEYHTTYSAGPVNRREHTLTGFKLEVKKNESTEEKEELL